MAWMETTPGTYDGLCVQPASIAPGHWCFQSLAGTGVLVYRPRSLKQFRGGRPILTGCSAGR